MRTPKERQGLPWATARGLAYLGTLTGPCCGTCKWFNGPNNAGHCRRHAPPWPGVIDSDYCGEYSVARWYEERSDRLASEASAPSRRDDE